MERGKAMGSNEASRSNDAQYMTCITEKFTEWNVNENATDLNHQYEKAHKQCEHSGPTHSEPEHRHILDTSRKLGIFDTDTVAQGFTEAACSSQGKILFRQWLASSSGTVVKKVAAQALAKTMSKTTATAAASKAAAAAAKKAAATAATGTRAAATGVAIRVAQKAEQKGFQRLAGLVFSLLYATNNGTARTAAEATRVAAANEAAKKALAQEGQEYTQEDEHNDNRTGELIGFFLGMILFALGAFAAQRFWKAWRTVDQQLEGPFGPDAELPTRPFVPDTPVEKYALLSRQQHAGMHKPYAASTSWPSNF